MFGYLNSNVMMTYSRIGERKMHLEGDHQVDRVPDSPNESLA